MRRIITAREQVQALSPWRRMAMSPQKIYRGLQVDLPPELEKQFQQWNRPAMDESEVGQHLKIGPALLDHLQAAHPLRTNEFVPEPDIGMGRHWTARPEFADTASRQGGKGGKGHHQVVIEADHPGEQHLDPDRKYQGGEWHSEEEANLRPGAPLNVTSVKWNGHEVLHDPYYEKSMPEDYGLPYTGGPRMHTAGWQATPEDNPELTKPTKLYRGVAVHSVPPEQQERWGDALDYSDGDTSNLGKHLAVGPELIEHLHNRQGGVGRYWTTNPTRAWDFAGRSIENLNKDVSGSAFRAVLETDWDGKGMDWSEETGMNHPSHNYDVDDERVLQDGHQVPISGVKLTESSLGGITDVLNPDPNDRDMGHLHRPGLALPGHITRKSTDAPPERTAAYIDDIWDIIGRPRDEPPKKPEPPPRPLPDPIEGVPRGREEDYQTYSQQEDRTHTTHLWMPTEIADHYKEYDHPLDDPQTVTLEKAIREHGDIRQPLTLTANATHGLITEGNHRIAIAKKLGIPEVPVRLMYHPTQEIPRNNPGHPLSLPPVPHHPAVASWMDKNRHLFPLAQEKHTQDMWSERRNEGLQGDRL